MGLLIKLQNGDTALKSLKFGKDRPGGGDSGQPYIQDPILDNPLPESEDFLLNYDVDIKKLDISEKHISGVLNLNKFKLNIVDRIRKDLIRIEKEKIKEKNDYKSNKIIIYDVRMINIYNNIKNGEEINVFVPQEIFELENNNDVLKEAHMQLIMDFLL